MLAVEVKTDAQVQDHLMRSKIRDEVRSHLKEARGLLDQSQLMLSKDRREEAVEYLDQALEKITLAIEKFRGLHK